MVNHYYGSFIGGARKSPAGDVAGQHYQWMDAVQPFVKSAQVFNCPDQNGGGDSLDPADCWLSSRTPAGPRTAGPDSFGSYVPWTPLFDCPLALLAQRLIYGGKQGALSFDIIVE